MPEETQAESSSLNQPKGKVVTTGPELSSDEFLRELPRQGNTPVIGPVKLQAKISKGGMGVVYRGHHVKLDIDVAVKFLSPYLASNNPEYVLRFEREARIAAQINNENLVRVFDIDSEKNYHYVVMELVCGETARERVARKGPLPVGEAVEIVRGATRGLEAAHRREVVHRDIKPDNILIDSAGMVKLADLGIAKMTHEAGKPEEITQSGIIMGTPSYMSPEQCFDPRSVGPPADVYSMGATLYFLLTGKAPYGGSLSEIFHAREKKGFPDIRKERADITQPVLTILSRCTRRAPRDRYPDASALLEDLKQVAPDTIDLSDAGAGSVRAQAKVSTPPAKRVGEIRFAISDRSTAPATGLAGGSRWRRSLAAGGVVLFLGLCLAGGGFLAFRKIPPAPGNIAGNVAPPGRPETGRAAVPASEHSPPLAGATSPQPETQELRVASDPPAPLPAPTAQEVGAQERHPELARMQSELKRAHELAESGDLDEAQRILVALLDQRLPRHLDEALRQELAGLNRHKEGKTGEERRKAQQDRVQSDLKRARESTESGRLDEAQRILVTFQDQSLPSPDLDEALRQEVARLNRSRIKESLSREPSRWKEALEFLKHLRNGPAAAQPGSFFAAAFQDCLEHATRAPSPSEPESALRERLDFLRELSPPPRGMPGLTRAHAESGKVFLDGLLGGVPASLSGNRERSRMLLALAQEVSLDQKLRAALPEWSLQRLTAIQTDLKELEDQDLRWQNLADSRKKASTLNGLLSLSLTDADLEQHRKGFHQFITNHPRAVRIAEANSLLQTCQVAIWAKNLVSPQQLEAGKQLGLEAAKEFQLDQGTSLRLLLVPGGKYQGTEIKEFYLGIHEVTREVYEQVMEGQHARRSAPEERDLPASGLTGEDAERFCQRLGETLSSKGVRLRFRLPSELEWEYACSAGSSGSPALPSVDEAGWYWLNSQQRPHPVGTKRVNPWGFFDMLGNIREWSLQKATADSAGGKELVVKGGCWNDSIHYVKPTARRLQDSKASDHFTGFRLALEP